MPKFVRIKEGVEPWGGYRAKVMGRVVKGTREVVRVLIETNVKRGKVHPIDIIEYDLKEVENL